MPGVWDRSVVVIGRDVDAERLPERKRALQGYAPTFPEDASGQVDRGKQAAASRETLHYSATDERIATI